jgi:site-specific DNA-methyltransferase (adenine-specific)
MTDSLFYGDNLNILRHMADDSVDLIYLDPPYNSKRDYNCSFGSVAQSKAFKDTWTWDEQDDIHIREIIDRNPILGAFLLSLGDMLPKRGLYPYLVNMAVRLVEMHRVLKSTGSIYLHVDPTASHYLKLVMDQIFGGGNFRNEIIWCYTRMASSKQRHLSRLHDTILWYTKTDEYTFEPDRIRQEYAASSKARAGYKKTNLGGGSPKTGICELNEGGKFPQDWIEIPLLRGGERLGYPTQKPLALLERIILASSNEGDVVLDPYMGSGTTIEAAAKHGRKFIGMDITHHAVATAVGRLEEVGVHLEKHQIIGIPEDTASARKLKTDSPRQFDAWCVLQSGAQCHDDGDRIVGLRNFPSISKGKEHLRRAMYMATNDDPPTMADIKTAEARMKKLGCEVGFLFCFEMPEDPAVLQHVNRRAPYTDDLRSIPSLQLITMRDLIHGNSATNLISEWRQRRLRDLSKQMELV